MSGIVDYNPGAAPGPDNASPEAAFHAWVTLARKDASANVATYEAKGQASGWPYTADIAALGALNGVDELLGTVKFELDAHNSVARLSGARPDGLTVDITVQGGQDVKNPVWQVTNYSLDVPDKLCEGVRKAPKG